MVANHKRIYRVYAEGNVQVRKRVKRRVAWGRGDVARFVSLENEQCSLNFIHTRYRIHGHYVPLTSSMTSLEKH
jgi:hypothetical protein